MTDHNHFSEGSISAPDETYLFVLRVWAQPGDAAGSEEFRWCGKVQEILSSKGGYFADWPALVSMIQSMLPGPQPDVSGPGGPQET